MLKWSDYSFLGNYCTKAFVPCIFFSIFLFYNFLSQYVIYFLVKFHLQIPSILGSQSVSTTIGHFVLLKEVFSLSREIFSLSWVISFLILNPITSSGSLCAFLPFTMPFLALRSIPKLKT